MMVQRHSLVPRSLHPVSPCSYEQVPRPACTSKWGATLRLSVVCVYLARSARRCTLRYRHNLLLLWRPLYRARSATGRGPATRGCSSCCSAGEIRHRHGRLCPHAHTTRLPHVSQFVKGLDKSAQPCAHARVLTAVGWRTSATWCRRASRLRRRWKLIYETIYTVMPILTRCAPPKVTGFDTHRRTDFSQRRVDRPQFYTTC